MLFPSLYQLYSGSQCTYPCFPVALLTSILQNILSHKTIVKIMDSGDRGTIVCFGFYAVSTVFQLFNSNSSQIHVSWTIFLTSSYPVHSHNPGQQGEKPLLPVLKMLVFHGQTVYLPGHCGG